LANIMRLSLTKGAHAAVSSAAWQEIRVRSGRDDKSHATPSIQWEIGTFPVTNLSSRPERSVVERPAVPFSVLTTPLKPLRYVFCEGYGLQPVHKPNKGVWPLGPEVRSSFRAESQLFAQHVRDRLYFLLSRADSMAAVTCGESGVTADSNRSTGLPLRSNRNLVKFHLISPPICGLTDLSVRKT
jgi:hypothetical protein